MLEGVNWPAFFLAMAIVELTPGPNMGWLVSLSAQSGRRAGLTAVAGITLGLTLQMLAAAIGVSALLAQSQMLYDTLRWGGVIFMLYLALQSWRETGESSPGKGQPGAGFWRGVIANLLNPKALVFYIAVVGQFADAARGPLWLQIIVLGSLHVLIALLVHVGIVLLGERLGARMKGLQSSVAVRAGFALSLVAIAIWIAVSTAR